jgi:PAS domain S-box-containing protein
VSDNDNGHLVERFVDGLGDCAIYVIDTDGNVLTWNKGARAILGYAPSEIIGRHFSRFYAKADLAIAAVKDALVHGRHDEIGPHVRKDGTEVETKSVMIPLYDAQHRLTGFGNMMYGLPGPIRAVAENVEAQMAAASAPVPAPAAASIAVGPAPGSQAGGEQVLLVDDNDDVRAVAQRQLTSLGYRVIATASGAEALAILELGTEIDLLFTDVVMPDGMGGKELAVEAEKIRPGIKTLFASGYFEGALQRNGAIDEDVNFIVKPYKKAELARKVRGILYGRDPQA